MTGTRHLYCSCTAPREHEPDLVTDTDRLQRMRCKPRHTVPRHRTRRARLRPYEAHGRTDLHEPARRRRGCPGRGARPRASRGRGVQRRWSDSDDLRNTSPPGVARAIVNDADYNLLNPNASSFAMLRQMLGGSPEATKADPDAAASFFLAQPEMAAMFETMRADQDAGASPGQWRTYLSSAFERTTPGTPSRRRRSRCSRGSCASDRLSKVRRRTGVRRTGQFASSSRGAPAGLSCRSTRRA